MRNALLSSLWAIAGGFIALILACWVGVTALFLVFFEFGKTATGVEVDSVTFFFALPICLLVGVWCKRLFYRGKLPGYRPKK